MNRLLIVAGLVSALLPVGCGRHKPKPAMPPLQVETARAVTDSIPNRMSFIGYLSSNFDAVIQPRINGFLLSKRFSNGMPVKRGQLLFTIDPDQLSTTMLAAEAALQSAKAQALEAQNNYERAVPLAKINAISQAQGVNSVWVVRPDSTAAYRRVVLGDTYGTMWCVDEGLAEGEQVVTAGQQKLRNGMKVIPVIR